VHERGGVRVCALKVDALKKCAFDATFAPVFLSTVYLEELRI
jgi:hypothetical protein